MHGPDDHRGVPPGGWSPDPNRPTGGAGWPAGATGPGEPSVAPGAPRAKLDPPKLFGIVIAALGALNFVVGFLPYLTSSRIDESLSVYAVGPAYVPILLLIAGLLALAAFLPGSERSRLAVAAVSVGGAVGAVIALGTTGPVELLTSAQVSKGLGAVLLTIFGVIQAVVAIGAYVVGADIAPRSVTRMVATIVPDQTAPAGGSNVVHDARAPQGQVRSTPWSMPATPPQAQPAPPGSVAYYAGYAPMPGSRPGGDYQGWAPPADDRPTGPQQVVDPNAAAQQEHSRQGPAERELPRVVPGGPGGPPAEESAVPDTPDSAASAPTDVHRVPPRPASSDESRDS
jgi:hypothetical protein